MNETIINLQSTSAMGKKKKELKYVYCTPSKQTRRVYETQEDVMSKIAKDDKGSIYPLNYFYCSSCNGWHYGTRHPVINGQEKTDDKVLAWEKEQNRARGLSASISNLIKKISECLKWGQYPMAQQLLTVARRKISQLSQIKTDREINEFTQKIESEEKYLFNSLRHTGQNDTYSQLERQLEHKKQPRKRSEELTPKIVQKIDTMIEEAERLSLENSNQAYDLIRECRSQIDHLKYGDELPKLKRQWEIKIILIRRMLKK